MNSSSSRLDDEQRRREEIQQQIALLQAQLTELPPNAEPEKRPQPSTPKRKQHDSTLLVPSTPSPSAIIYTPDDEETYASEL